MTEDDHVPPPPKDQSVMTRGYQQEMLDESLRKNIIIAMDTGSGKTHIAVLRMKIEAERESNKLSWFMAPTRALCNQQRLVIQEAIAVPVGLISGSIEPDQWTDKALWQTVLNTYRIMVSTPQVLLDALRHGYINLGIDIGLLIFDEAHHAVADHPYNAIMKDFYFSCPPRVDPTDFRSHKGGNVRPMVLGLTASPIYGGNVISAFRTIERNLDSIICAPRREREELRTFVHRPVFKKVLYRADPFPFSTNLAAFNFIFQSLNIENDPYVVGLRKKLAKTDPQTPEYTRLDQRLSKTILTKNSYTHGGLQDVANTADAICSDIGPWAADWYICKAIEQAKASITAFDNVVSGNEKAYLKGILDTIVVTPLSYYFEDIVEESSDKVRVLVECLLAEKLEAETHDESYSGLIFVERRESVLALAEVLSHHPETKDVFSVGSLIGAAGSGYKHSVLDITRPFLKSQNDSLTDFQAGKKNLIVSTAVAEEGIDIQACGSVIRWDPPPNMPSWAQSRGRARRKRSTFTLMFERDGAHQKTVNDWEILEREMVALYNDASRNVKYAEEEEGVCDDNDIEFRVEATGALLTLHSAVSHLNHFCAVIPNSAHADHRPLYDIDPPDLPEGWHSNRSIKIELYPGPYGAKVTLPRILPSHLRVFETDRIHSTKASAYRHAAFYAYRALYENGLLNDNLLPLTSVVEPELEDEVKALLEQVERRAGTARVSMQMDPWAPIDTPSIWYTSELVITGLPPLLLFTRSKPTEWSGNDGPILYRPDCQESVTLQPFPLEACSETIARAREYTRQLFWCINGSRMSWDDLDFSYLFLPNGSDDSVWNARRLWHTQKNSSGTPFSANALAFGQDFSYPDDLSIIRNGPQFNKAYKFVRWRFDPLTTEEEEDMKTFTYSRFSDLEITYPLLVVHHLPPRTNFLIPIPERASPPAPPKEIHLLPQMSYVTLCSEADAQYAFLLPSVLRSMEMSITMNSLREALFSDLALSEVPERLLTTAMCAPVSQEKTNYQRLETLGDTVLKFMSSIQLLAEYPLWPEGYLTQKMGHCVSNVRLAKENIKRRLYQWIIRDRLLGKKWKPKYFTKGGEEVKGVEDDSDVNMGNLKGKKKAEGQDLSTKVLADVVESLIGAVYLHGGFDYAFLCARFFDMNIKWEPLPLRIQTMLNRVETDSDLPLHQLEPVERMLGYTFTHKLLLMEALTHASYQYDSRTVSYERLEFCGDAVLDMIMTDFLYRAEGKEYSPGHMHHRKSAMVNAHTLAFFCLSTHLDISTPMPGPSPGSPRPSYARHGPRQIQMYSGTQTIHLWQCLLHSNPHIIDEQKAAYKRFTLRRAEIEAAFASGAIFPWAGLFRLQAPKFLSDMIESLLGAVFLDSQGDLDAVRRVLRKLGLLDVLERVVEADVDVLHPVSQLSMWASKRGKKLSWDYTEEAKEISCAVVLDDEVVEESRVVDEYRGKLTKDEVRVAASEKAVIFLRARDNSATLKRKRCDSSISVLRAAPSSPPSHT